MPSRCHESPFPSALANFRRRWHRRRMAAKLLDHVREEIRARHYSRRTEEAYIHWIRQYIRFHGLRHPRELGSSEIAAFLTWLAVDRHVAASTQNQAFSGVLFLYR